MAQRPALPGNEAMPYMMMFLVLTMLTLLVSCALL